MSTLTEGHTNLARVAQMVLGPCTYVLRDVLRKEIPPSDLETKVRAYIAQTKTQNKKPLINPDQETLVYGQDYSKFDVTLLYFLLRNMCSIEPHSEQWGKDPLPGDKTVSANIERIRLIRNKDYGHSSRSISDKDFEKIYQDIKIIVQELEKYLGSSTKYQDEVKQLKTCPMDPAKSEEYIKELLSLREKIKDISEDVEKMKNIAVPMNKQVLYERETLKWKEDDSVFLETHNFPAVLEQVRTQPYVTFVGAPGSGKTATARHIALILQKEGYDILPILEISKIDDYCSSSNPQVFVIDDVLGVFGLHQQDLYTIQRYHERLEDPINSKTKTLMTCREPVFKNEMMSDCLLAKTKNVVYLQSKENALNEDDKRNLLNKYNLDRDLLNSDQLTSSSKMFPFLCKLFSSKKEFQAYGPTFFITPIPCIKKEMDSLKIHNKHQYASLVLLMATGNRLSEKMFDNEMEETIKETVFAEMKCKILKNCKVPSNTDSFPLLDALSEMEGTYTKKSNNEFSFIHDSMFEVIAYHFGRVFPELIFQCASSNYIANYIKVDKDNTPKTKRGVKRKVEACEGREGIETFHENEKIIDLCIQLNESKYKGLAERLFRDVQNEEFDNVFRNKALKNQYVLQHFIAEMEKTTYDNLHNVFLLEKIWNYGIKQAENDKFASFRIGPRTCLLNEKLIDKEFRIHARGVAWAIFFGHNAILRRLINQMIQNRGNADDLFQTGINNFPQPNSNTGSCTSVDTDSDTDGREKDKKQKDTNPVIVEQRRLLCLACYSGDLNTVQLLLNHVNTAALNNWFRSTICSYYKNPLIIACKYGYQDIVTKLIEAGAEVNSGFLKETPLTTACKNERHSIVTLLLQMGADVNHGDPLYNYTPLQYACQNGSTLLVEGLIKAGADVNLSRHGGTPLLEASKNGLYSQVKQLVLAGVDVNKESEGTPPLIAACDGGHFNVMKLLMKSGAKVDPNAEDKTTLNFTSYVDHLMIINKLIKMESSFDVNDTNKMSFIAECYSGRLSVVKEMIKDGADVNMIDGYKTPLIVACYKEHEHVVKELIEAGADVNLGNDFISPLQVACYEGHLGIAKQLSKVEFDGSQKSSVAKALIGACFFGHLSVVKELIACHIEVNLKHGKETPLTTTCYMGHLDIFKELIKAGADVNLNNGCGTPLTNACQRNHLNIVRMLIDMRADVNQSDGNKTPLTAACKFGHLTMVVQLIWKRANVNQSDGNKTPLTIACEFGHRKVVEELIWARADVNQSDGNKTPLTAACEFGHWGVVKILIRARADVNQSDGNKTPLTAACEFGHYNVVEELIRAGADVNQSDENKTPLTAARKYGHGHIIHQLIAAGAYVN